MEKNTEENQEVYYPCTLPSSARIFFLRISEIQEKHLSGEIIHLFFHESVPFSGLDDAILKIDRMMDELNCPQASTLLRDFRMSRKKRVLEESQREESEELPQFRKYWDESIFGKMESGMPSCMIRVLYRQNSSWQGEVTWSSSKKKVYRENFRSVLELMYLIQSSLVIGGSGFI